MNIWDTYILGKSLWICKHVYHVCVSWLDWGRTLIYDSNCGKGALRVLQQNILYLTLDRTTLLQSIFSVAATRNWNTTWWCEELQLVQHFQKSSLLKAAQICTQWFWRSPNDPCDLNFSWGYPCVCVCVSSCVGLDRSTVCNCVCYTTLYC